MELCKIVRVFDESIEMKENAMLKARPELFYEWDFKKNIDLDIYKATRGSGKVAWWDCPNCKSSYNMSVSLRAGSQKQNCPYCHGKRVNHTNSLASIKPELSKEWHPTKNGKLTPHDITYVSSERVWWLAECGHEWETRISHRKTFNTGCPYCSSHKVLAGFNDMWTTSPDLAKLLANPEDGYKYTDNSGNKVDWKCLHCHNIIKNKHIYSINTNGLSCPKCSDGISFPERFVYNLLKENKIKFVFDTPFEWSQGRRYDFYLPDYNWIIEVHGLQHYGKGFSGFGGRHLKEEQENDIIKERMALDNQVVNYIVVDARESTMKHIKNSIINSDLIDMLSEVDFIKIGMMASTSLVKTACDYWCSDIHSTTKISGLMHISRSTIIKYLKRGVELGWCDYCPKESSYYTSKQNGMKGVRNIVQLSTERLFIRKWESLLDACISLNIGSGNLSAVCTGKRQTTGGFRWMYKEDYYQMIQEGLTHEEYMNRNYSKDKQKVF